MALNSFPSVNRIKRSDHFNHVFKSGFSVSNSFAKIVGAPTFTNDSKIGIIAGKRVGNSVFRNLAKRRLREFARQRGLLLNDSLDYVFVAHSDIVKEPHFKVDKQLEKLVERINQYFVKLRQD